MNSSGINGPAEKSPDGARGDPGELPDDPRLMQAVQEYLKQLEDGQAPNRPELLRRYPDLMGPLAQCLDGLELVHKAAIRKKPPVSGPAAAAHVLPANPLGDFQILREIGRGGMGIVYEALQLSLGRRVALKVLPFAATFDARHLQRFENEARAAAQLHHTNIVPVYAVGCERGVHYYAMQLIEGQSLAAVIHQIKRQESGDRRQLSGDKDQGTGTKSREGEATGPFLLDSGTGRPLVESAEDTASPLSVALTTHRSSHNVKFFFTVARFMVQAAEAVEHAHQFGIVHRDIKPANLLVDVHNRLWITDFGLAQFHTDANLTQTGDIMGTLRYMSPEQASGKKVLDHRTDVYSLGATLYELVTMEPIFPGRNRQELLHQIINDEPRAPRMLDKTIPVELETIILKAVSKNVGDRYGSAQDLAADLQRYLDDKPIYARRPSMVERARKWSRRHPSVVVAAVMMLVVCFVGLSVSNWMIAKEQAKTHAALRSEQAALKSEKERAKQARNAVNLLVEVSEEDLADNPFTEDIRRKLLETAREYYQTLIENHGSDLAEQADLEQSKNRVRDILDELATLQAAKLIDLATEPDVQTDMKIAQDKRTQLDKLYATWSDERRRFFHEGPPKTPEGPRQAFYKLAKDHEAKLSDILQQKLPRLQQIYLQVQGARAFRDSYAVGLLKLTPEQRQEIRTINDKARVFGGPREKRGPGDKGKNWRIDIVQKAEVEKIVAVLTPSQRNSWHELTGPPFEGTLRRPPPGFGGGPGPKGGDRPPPKDGPRPQPPPGAFGSG